MRYDTLVAGARRGDGLDPVRPAAVERARWARDLLERGAEGDRPSLILGKAFLLAADHRITDGTIRDRIEPAATRP